MNERIDGLRQRMKGSGADAVLISSPYNRRYLTGFTGTDSPGGGTAGWLFVTANEAIFLVGFLSLEQARHECPDVALAEVPAGKHSAVVGQLAREHGVKRLACEGNHLTHLTFVDLAGQLPEGCELVPVEGWVEGQRLVKSEEEIAKIRHAAAITDRALEHVLGVVRPGMTESELAWEAERFMREHGADGMAFEVSVASGANTSIPHHRGSDKKIQAGEPIWIDMGAQADGYCSDLTRSFCLGKPEERLREIWDLVYRAQAAAIAGTHAHMPGVEADALARNLIAEAGHGAAFGHSLGHGVGLVVHEGPRLSQTSTDVLQPNMVATFEPGVYLEGWGGVRIEDLGVIREGGVELLSEAPKQLVVA